MSEINKVNSDTIERKIKMVGVLKDGTEIQTELFIREIGSAILVAEDVALIIEIESLDDLEKAFEEISNH
mgnify:CR=1 FL=1